MEEPEGQAIEETPEEQSPDLASLEVDVGGQTMTVDNLVKSYGESRNKMHEAIRESQEARKRLEDLSAARQLWDEVQEDPALFDHLRSYYNESGKSGPDKNAQTIQRLERKLSELEIDRGIDAIRSAGLPLDESQERELLEHMYRTGIRDAKDAYYAYFGPNLIKQERDKTLKDIAKKLKEGEGYKPPPKGKAEMPAKPVEEMSKGELDASILAAITEAMGKD